MLVAFLHEASVERLRGPDIVRIKPGERAGRLCRDVHGSLPIGSEAGYLVGARSSPEGTA
jgi:hypothetical protein